MNYFELHIGDLTEATAHLSMVEDGAYGRLMRKYYATEKPLPAAVEQVQRLIGPRGEDERDAVLTVLREFFELRDDGWHQNRCDAEIENFHAKQVGKAGKRENAKERQRRARERRAELFSLLRGHDVVPPWTTTSAELEATLSRVTGERLSQPVTPPVTRDDTATQTPDTRHQTPSTNVSSAAASATAKRGQRLSPDWVLPKAWGDWALTEYPHWTEETVRLIARKFRDHWAPKTGKDATKLDWLATWRNWCSSGITQKEHPPPHAMNGHAMTFKERDTENARTKLDRLTGGRATAPRTPKPVDPFLQLQGLDDDTPRLPGA